MKWIFDRLKEKSTWVVIIGTIAGITGVAIQPELQEQITTAGMAVFAIVGIATKENG